MATKSQIKANRQNAQKSTGPKTDEGKAAVSQNAVKHGIFAESVIYGENEVDYEAFHEKLFAEIDPVGAVELMLAERAVNLSWRLRRAERMQNEVIEDMIGRLVTSNPARRARECYIYNQGRRPEDPGVDLDDLPLGRIATHDWSSSKVLDRMLMYERRIENSMMKTMRELERRKMIRQVEQQFKPEQAIPSTALRACLEPVERTGPIPIKDNRDSLGGHHRKASLTGLTAEAATREEQLVDMKKQSQFVPGQNGAKSCLKGDYESISDGVAEENKPKQSQIQTGKRLTRPGRGETAPVHQTCQ